MSKVLGKKLPQFTKKQRQDAERLAAQQVINDVLRRVDEFDSFLIETADDAEFSYEEPDALVEIVGPDYAGRITDFSAMLSDFRDTVLDHQNRLKKARVRPVR